jgi:hypothetical protein
LGWSRLYDGLFGLRIGRDPKAVVTTTPQPTKLGEGVKLHDHFHSSGTISSCTDQLRKASKFSVSSMARGISKRFSEATLAGTWGRSAAGEDRLDFWRD